MIYEYGGTSMKNDVTLYEQVEPSKYSKLQHYDYSEFNGRKYQALKVHFNCEDFSFIRFKSGRYDNCIFENCTFKSAGLSGTHFISCELKNFEVFDTNMQFCDFSQNCILKGIDRNSLIYSSNLSQSMFHDSELEKICFKSTTISQARFINTSFQNIIWESCTLQDNLFDNVTMENVSLVGCNLEYSDFKKVKLTNVKLPLHQLPYAFGLLDCLKSSPEEILIDAVSSKCDPMKPKEYLRLLPDLHSYYREMNEYFPAINIALFNENYEDATDLIDAGTQYYIHTNDFRKIKGLCKLIALHPFYDKHFMTQLYFKLVDYYNHTNVSECEKYQYSLHINDIKKILTDFADEMPIAQLYLKTNITSLDIERLGVFYQLIEQCLGDYNISTEEYSVEIRHNSSPLSFWITLCQQDPKIIVNAIGIIMSVVTSNPYFLQNALSVVSNISTIGSFALQIGQAFHPHTKAATSDCPDVTAQDIQYIRKKNQILKNSKISIEISLPFFNFSYQNEKKCGKQN